MKKYMRLFITFAFTVLVIGILYIQHVVANYDAVMLKTLAGNDVELRKVVLDLSIWKDDINIPARLGNGKIHISNQYSLWETITGAKLSPEIKNLIKKERNFMRGKVGNNENYFEDEEYLAYVNVHYITELRIENKGTPEQYEYYHHVPGLIVDVLEKESDKRWSFPLELPDDEDISFINVEDVQLMAGVLKVLTRVSPYEEGEYYQFSTIDFTTGKIIATSKIEAPEEAEAISFINNMKNLKPEHYYLFSIPIVKEEDMASEEVSEKYYLFNLETEEMTELSFDPELYGKVVTAEDGEIYFANQQNGLEVTVYNIETEELKTFSFPDVKDDEGFTYVRQDHGNYYIAKTNQRNTIRLFIVEGESGEILYEGEISHNDEQIEIYLADLSVL